jgi:hypothetical protein
MTSPTSDLLPVRVLAPVRHVPVRSRTVRLSYLPVTVPVPLRVLGPADHSEGPLVPMPGGRPVQTRIVDGRLWRPVRYKDGNATPIAESHLREWLTGERSFGNRDHWDAEKCFAGTPLAARLPHRQGQLRDPGDPTPDQVGRIHSDHRERAARIGAAYVAGSVASLSRMPGPVAFLDASNGLRRIVRHPHTAQNYAKALHAIPFRADRGGEQADFEGRHPLYGDNARTEWKDEWPGGMFDGLDLDNDDDIDLGLAETLRVMLTYLADDPLDLTPHPPERLARLHDMAGLASVGLVEPGERIDLCALIGQVVGDHGADGPGATHAWRIDNLKRHAAYVREVAVPRLVARQPAMAEDLEALSAFAPR